MRELYSKSRFKKWTAGWLTRKLSKLKLGKGFIHSFKRLLLYQVIPNLLFANNVALRDFKQSPEEGSPISNSRSPDYGWSGVFSELNLEIFWYLFVQNLWFSLCVNIIKICFWWLLWVPEWSMNSFKRFHKSNQICSLKAFRKKFTRNTSP